MLALALGLRLATCFCYPLIQESTELSRGSDGYELVAEMMVAGYGYRFAPELSETMFLPPTYPLFLTLLFAVAGPHVWASHIAQSLLDTATCFLIYKVGSRCANPRIGFWAGLAYAFYPGAWIGCSRYVTEPLFAFLIVLFLFGFIVYLHKRHWVALLTAGVACGLAVLCKSVAGMLPVFLIICAVVLPVFRGMRKPVLSGLLVCLLVSLVLVAPWVYRNYRLSGSPVYPSTSGGLALYTAYVYAANPEQRIRQSANQAAAEVCELAEENGIRLHPGGHDYPRWFYSAQEEVCLDRIAQKVARERIAGDWGAFAHHVGGNLWRFWWGAPTPTSVVFSVLVNTPFLILGVLGLFFSRVWRHAGLSFCLAVAAYLFLAHVGILAVVRYSLTVMPILCLFSGFTLAGLCRRRDDKQVRSDQRSGLKTDYSS
jgi:4-amino-4-deoxy-L-arabinose transferase-like glycosyltransferase